MSVVKPDVVALVETMEVVTKASKIGLWNQGTWLSFGSDHVGALEWQNHSFCGTAGCFAGWRAILDGAALRRTTGNDPSHPYLDYVQFPDGSRSRVGDIGIWASKRFGITDEQGEALFSGRNNLKDLERIVGEIVASAIAEEKLPVVESVGVGS